MIGLIYKDLCCLRKNIKIFILVTLVVIVLSVLFIFSMQYGNIATFIRTEGISEEEFFNLFQVAIWAILILPIAAASMIQECYKEDKRVNFSKCLNSLPVKPETIVGSRYLSGVAYLMLGLIGSVVASFFISVATDEFSFGQLTAYCITFMAGLLVYEAFVMFVLYIADGKKADLIQCIPLIVLLFVAEYFFVVKTDTMTDEEFGAFTTTAMEKINSFMIENCIWGLLAALLLVGISYLGSVLVQKKRGIS